MEPSPGVKGALLRFYAQFSTADEAGFDTALTRAEGALGIGTDADEWESGREAWLAIVRAARRLRPHTHSSHGCVPAGGRRLEARHSPFSRWQFPTTGSWSSWRSRDPAFDDPSRARLQSASLGTLSVPGPGGAGVLSL